MASSTHRILLPIGEYTNVSNGNTNCFVFLEYNQRLRVVIGGELPSADTLEYFDVGSSDDSYAGHRLGFKAGNLLLEDDVFVMPDGEFEMDIVVVRGDVSAL